MRRPVNFCQGESRPDVQKTAWTTFLFCFDFYSRQLILQFTGGGPMVLLQRKLYFSKDPKGYNIFQGGPASFRWGGEGGGGGGGVSKCFISI